MAKRSIKSSAADYTALLNDIKSRIRTSQIKAALTVNRELISLYWQIGQSIVQRQQADVLHRGTKKLADGIDFDFAQIGQSWPGGLRHEERDQSDVFAELSHEVDGDAEASPILELQGEGRRRAAIRSGQRITIGSRMRLGEGPDDEIRPRDRRTMADEYAGDEGCHQQRENGMAQ